jgi:GMP synthase-like glutamine amidotransferase
MKHVYIVNGGAAYHGLFTTIGYTITSDIREADLVVFTGGEDVSPELYGARKHHTTHNSEYRDRYEADIFNLALKMHLPMVGICRGGQFLNVMSGGEMYQDVTRHCGDHEITDLITGEVVMVSSTHHQMMKPSPNGVLVASAGMGGDRTWWDHTVFSRDVSKEDIEVVWYEETNCLCFQPHPEFTGPRYIGMFTYFKSLLERYFNHNLEEKKDVIKPIHVCECC